MEKLQHSLHTLEEEAELLRSKLSVVNQEKISHAQEVSGLHRELQDAERKVRNSRPSVSSSHHRTLTAPLRLGCMIKFLYYISFTVFDGVFF